MASPKTVECYHIWLSEGAVTAPTADVRRFLEEAVAALQPFAELCGPYDYDGAKDDDVVKIGRHARQGWRQGLLFHYRGRLATRKGSARVMRHREDQNGT